MGRFCIAILLIFSIKSYSKPPCKENYIRVVKTDSCRYVEMGVKTYADYYMHKKRLNEIKDIIPSIKDSIESLRIHKNEIKNNRDSWKEVSYDLEDSLIETEYKLEREKKNRPKWFGGGLLSALLILLIL